MVRVYHLGVAWEWEYDFDFVNLIAEKCKKLNLTVYFITPENLMEVYREVEGGEIKFLVYFDRASDTNEDFLKLNFLLESRGTRMINRYNNMVYALNKARMHIELSNAGVNLPFTFILPPFDESSEFEISKEVFERTGTPFIIKPSTETGGGVGVKVGHSIYDIVEARKEFPYDSYLVQEMIYPIFLYGKKAWFRSFYILGEVVTCWWDNEIKVYEMMKDEEVESLGISEIKNIMGKIYQVCKLDFFSSEIVLTLKDGEKVFVVVDYVNEVPDMRLKSKAIDGVPDEIVERIAMRIAEFVANLKSG